MAGWELQRASRFTFSCSFLFLASKWLVWRLLYTLFIRSWVSDYWDVYRFIFKSISVYVLHFAISLKKDIKKNGLCTVQSLKLFRPGLVRRRRNGKLDNSGLYTDVFFLLLRSFISLLSSFFRHRTKLEWVHSKIWLKFLTVFFFYKVTPGE